AEALAAIGERVMEAAAEVERGAALERGEHGAARALAMVLDRLDHRARERDLEAQRDALRIARESLDLVDVATRVREQQVRARDPAGLDPIRVGEPFRAQRLEHETVLLARKDVARPRERVARRPDDRDFAHGLTRSHRRARAGSRGPRGAPL